MTQVTQAQTFLSIHNTHKLLILPNVWNPIGAQMLEAKGFPAVATASAAIAESLGYSDGEQIKFTTMLDMVARIVRSVSIPVSADFEAGYSESTEGLQENASRMIDAGVAGINFEDSWDQGTQLRSIPEQMKRIQAIRDVAEKRNIHLFINARSDSFFADGFITDEGRIEDVINRCNAYIEAGADCVYPIGRGDKETLVILRQRIKSPLNVLATAKAASLNELQEIGINRVSFGPYIFHSLLAKMSAMFDEIKNFGNYAIVMNDTLSHDDIQKYLLPGKEP